MRLLFIVGILIVITVLVYLSHSLFQVHSSCVYNNAVNSVARLLISFISNIHVCTGHMVCATILVYIPMLCDFTPTD